MKGGQDGGEEVKRGKSKTGEENEEVSMLTENEKEEEVRKGGSGGEKGRNTENQKRWKR